MKIRLVLLLYISIFTAYAHAQTAVKIKGGMNLNGFALKSSDGSFKQHAFYPGDWNLGGQLGVAMTFNLNERVTLQPECLLVMRGAYREDKRSDIYYLDLPLLIDYTFQKKFSVQAGPVASFMLLTSGNSFMDKKSGDFTTKVDRLIFGITGGGTLKLTKRISVFAQYYYGFNDFCEVPLVYKSIQPVDQVLDYNPPEMKYYNRNISVGLLYTLLTF